MVNALMIINKLSIIVIIKTKCYFMANIITIELESIIKNSNVGVIPFHITEFNNNTIHNKLFDYFSYSKPVLVSECKPLERIINETDAGIVRDCSTAEKCKFAILEFYNSNIESMSVNAFNAFFNKYNLAT